MHTFRYYLTLAFARQGEPPSGAADGGAAPPPSAPPAGQASSWFEKLDPDMREWAANKGWKDGSADPAEIVKSYRSLEQMMGADKAGRTILLPKDENDKEAIEAIYKRLGRPDKPEEYEIALPDGADPSFSNTARQWFMDANLTKAQAAAVTKAYQAFELDQAQQLEQDNVRQIEALKKEWGGDYETKLEVGRAAAKAAGLSEQELKAMELAVGAARAARMLEFFGRNYVEGSPPDNNSRSNNGFGGLSPAQAKSRIEQLYQDKEFMARYSNNDPKVRAVAMEEMETLQKVAANVKI